MCQPRPLNGRLSHLPLHQSKLQLAHSLLEFGHEKRTPPRLTKSEFRPWLELIFSAVDCYSYQVLARYATNWWPARLVVRMKKTNLPDCRSIHQVASQARRPTDAS